MAFYDPDDENEQDPNQQQGGVQTSAGSGLISGQGGSSSNGPPAPAANSPDSPGNFVGIKTYLDANKPQAAKLGDQAAGVINSSADQARQGVQALQTQANDQIKGVGNLNSNISGKLSGAPETLTNDEKNVVKQTASAKYTGPKDETSFGDTYNNAAKTSKTATTNIDNSGTEQGRMNLISQINSKPRTQGMNIFDNTLLQAGGGREKLAQAAGANQDVKTALDNETQAIRGKIGRADDPSTPNIDESAGAVGQTNKAQADAYKQIQDAMTSWQSGFTPKVDQVKNQQLDLQNRVNEDLKDNQLSQETMDLLGLSDGQTYYNSNLRDYINPFSVSDINAGNVASQQDYARYAALSDLSGTDQTLLNPADAVKAGSAPMFGANKDKLSKDLQTSKNNFESAYNNQVGGVLNTSYLPPNTNWSQTMPNAWTAGKDVRGATPKELENFWIPTLKQAVAQTGDHIYQVGLDGIQKSLDQWKASQGFNNKVSKG